MNNTTFDWFNVLSVDFSSVIDQFAASNSSNSTSWQEEAIKVLTWIGIGLATVLGIVLFCCIVYCCCSCLGPEGCCNCLYYFFKGLGYAVGFSILGAGIVVLGAGCVALVLVIGPFYLLYKAFQSCPGNCDCACNCCDCSDCLTGPRTPITRRDRYTSSNAGSIYGRSNVYLPRDLAPTCPNSISNSNAGASPSQTHTQPQFAQEIWSLSRNSSYFQSQRQRGQNYFRPVSPVSVHRSTQANIRNSRTTPVARTNRVPTSERARPVFIDIEDDESYYERRRETSRHPKSPKTFRREKISQGDLLWIQRYMTGVSLKYNAGFSATFQPRRNKDGTPRSDLDIDFHRWTTAELSQHGARIINRLARKGHEFLVVDCGKGTGTLAKHFKNVCALHQWRFEETRTGYFNVQI